MEGQTEQKKQRNVAIEMTRLPFFHGPRKLVDYDKHGKLMEVKTKKAA